MLRLENSIHPSMQKAVALVSLLSLLMVLLPYKILHGSLFHAQAMEFPVQTRHQASLLFIARKKQVYEPSKQTIRIIVTSYNSVPEQTDSTPFITAFGTQVRDGIIATNYLPKGTKVRFPDLYGDKVFVVEDRMNIRYTKRVDIWSADKEFSKQFGARYLRMEIL